MRHTNTYISTFPSSTVTRILFRPKSLIPISFSYLRGLINRTAKGVSRGWYYQPLRVTEPQPGQGVRRAFLYNDSSNRWKITRQKRRAFSIHFLLLFFSYVYSLFCLSIFLLRSLLNTHHGFRETPLITLQQNQFVDLNALYSIRRWWDRNALKKFAFHSSFSCSLFLRPFRSLALPLYIRTIHTAGSKTV